MPPRGKRSQCGRASYRQSQCTGAGSAVNHWLATGGSRQCGNRCKSLLRFALSAVSAGIASAQTQYTISCADSQKSSRFMVAGEAVTLG